MSKRYRTKEDIFTTEGFCPKGTEGVYNNGIYEFRSVNNGKTYVIGDGIIDNIALVEPIPDTPAPEQTRDLAYEIASYLREKEITTMPKSIAEEIVKIVNELNKKQTTKEGLWSDEDMISFATFWCNIIKNTEAFGCTSQTILDTYKASKQSLSNTPTKK